MNRIEMNKKRRVRHTKNKTWSNNDNKKGNLLTEIFSDYCSSSTLHGINYLGARDKNLTEKIWWLIMFVLSVVVCSYVINKTLVKWKTSPVILSFETEQIPISEIPFPAVTVCPLNKVLQTEYNYTNMFRNRNYLVDKDYKQFWDVSLVCTPEIYIGFTMTSIEYTDKLGVTMLREIAPKLNETFLQILWQNKIISKDNFAEQMTQEGLCFTFNSFNQQEMYTDIIDHDMNYIRSNLINEGWTLENGYSQTSKMNTHPRRSAKDGRAYGLSFNLLSNLDENDYVCGMPTSGFKIILHNPAETPNPTQEYFQVPLNKMFTMIVRPDIISTSKSLKDLPAHTRKCYFSNEKYLRFFKVYTQNNCKTECLTNLTHQFCGCTPFYMPRDKRSPLCGYASNKCIKNIEVVMLRLEQMTKFSDLPETDRINLKYAYEMFQDCDCLPPCRSIQYSTETSETEIHVKKTLQTAGFINTTLWKLIDKSKMTTTEVQIFFKESQFFALHRSELYDQTDFLANCGGLLGLFMGFSLLSFMEIFYFSTIRLWFKYRNRRQIQCR